MKVDESHPFYPRYRWFRQRWFRISMGIWAIAWGIGFIRYFDHWVFFPAFPNILDSIGMALIGIYLLRDVVIRAKT